MMNPYVYDQPVIQREGFYGQLSTRRSEIVRIYSRLAADRPQSVSIVGEPRIGKTSLLNWLYHEDTRGDYVDPATYVYLLLSLREQPAAHPEAFFAQVSDAAQGVGHGTITPLYEDFRGWVESLMGDGKRLILFCDDFGLITQNRAFPLEFFSFMRSMANNYDVAYVTTSSAELHTLCASQDVGESPFFNIFTTVILRPFNDEEARQLILEPASAAGVSFEDEVDWMLELAGPLPYLLQLTASLAFDARVNGTLKPDDVEEHAFKSAQPFLNLLWEAHFSPVQRAVLKLICDGHAIEPRNRYAAEELERRGYLKRLDDTYEIHSTLLKRFVSASRKRRFWRRLFG